MPAPAHNLNAGGVLIIAAVRTEVAPLLKGAARDDAAGVWRISGRDAVLAVTGMGEQRMTEAAELLIDRCRPSLLINVGFAAALNPSLIGGDVVWVHDVVRDGAAPVHVADHPPFVREALGDLPTAKLLTTGGVVGSSEIKRKLAASHGTDALDMETYSLAILAKQHALPLVVLKAISDPCGMSLPPQVASWVDVEGNPKVWPAALFALTHPQRIPMLLALNRHATRGAAGLARRVCRLLDGRGVH